MNNSQPRTSLREQLHCIHPQHTHSTCTSTCTTHPDIPSQLPSTTLLCTQLTNTKQNGTRCRDSVNVLWWHSYPVWLVFEGSIPTCACFHSENFFVTCILSECMVQAGSKVRITHRLVLHGLRRSWENVRELSRQLDHFIISL